MQDNESIRLSAHEKASAARLLLEHPMLQAAFERMEEEYVELWRNSAPHQQDVRDNAYARLRCLEALKTDLEAVMHGGRVADYNSRTSLRTTGAK